MWKQVLNIRAISSFYPEELIESEHKNLVDIADFNGPKGLWVEFWHLNSPPGETAPAYMENSLLNKCQNFVADFFPRFYS